jgi:hypothetical protein
MEDSGMAEEPGKETMSKSTEEVRHEARDADRLVVELTAEARGLPRKIEAAVRGDAKARTDRTGGDVAATGSDLNTLSERQAERAEAEGAYNRAKAAYEEAVSRHSGLASREQNLRCTLKAAERDLARMEA